MSKRNTETILSELKNIFAMKTMTEARCILKDGIIRNLISILKEVRAKKPFFCIFERLLRKSKT